MKRGHDLRCKCGSHEVPNSDIAALIGRTLIVHGLYHCYAMPAYSQGQRA